MAAAVDREDQVVEVEVDGHEGRMEGVAAGDDHGGRVVDIQAVQGVVGGSDQRVVVDDREEVEAVVEVEDDQDDEVHGEGVHVEGEGVIQGEGMRPCED